MNPFTMFLAACGTLGSAASVCLFAREGYKPLRRWFLSRADRDAERYQSWVDELSLDWDAEAARRAALAARIGVIAATSVIFLVTWDPVFAAVVAGVAYWIPLLIFRVLRSQRLRKMEEQIPDAIDVMVASVRAGNSLATAVEDVEHRMKRPISREFAVIASEHRAGGLSIEDALGRARNRIPVESFTMVASALIINAGQGGDLMHILERIAEATRELYRLQKKIMTETAEVRAQEKIIMLMTPLFLVLVCFFDPSIPDILFHSIPGRFLLIVVAAIQAVGFIWIHRIVRTTV
jgi:tight adherence protein B